MPDRRVVTDADIVQGQLTYISQLISDSHDRLSSTQRTLLKAHQLLRAAETTLDSALARRVARDTRRAHVAVVHDDPRLRRRLVRLVGHEGYAATGYPLAAETFAMIQHQRPDLVILDVDGGPESGWYAARRLRAMQATRTTPLVLLTTDPELRDRQPISPVKDCELTLGPLDVPAFVDVVHRLLADRRGRVAKRRSLDAVGIERVDPDAPGEPFTDDPI